GGAESSFGGTPFAEPLQNSLHVADAISLTDVFDHCERFVVGEDCLLRRKMDEAGFQHVERDIAMLLEDSRKSGTSGGQGFRFEELSDALVQPLRATAY